MNYTSHSSILAAEYENKHCREVKILAAGCNADITQQKPYSEQGILIQASKHPCSRIHCGMWHICKYPRSRVYKTMHILEVEYFTHVAQQLIS
jgi:hypothetical protein